MIQHPRGKVLGGSSAINFMNWTQTSRIDLDAWEKLGNRGWNWDVLLPYFLKAETFHEPTEAAREFYPVEASVFNASRRGTNGPIQTGLPETNDFVSKLWPETCRNAGINAGNPPNEPREGYSLGGYNHLLTIDPRTGQRSYAASGYFAPYAERSNLLVLTDALAQKVNFSDDPSGLIATGVDFVVNEVRYSAQATREVIISSGVFQSPQLLELSGIGSPDVLQKAAVEVKFENKNVGENLQDHIIGANMFDLKEPLPETHKVSFLTCANLPLDEITKDDPLDFNMEGNEEHLHEAEYKLQRQTLTHPHHAAVSLVGAASGTHSPTKKATPLTMPARFGNKFRLVTSLMHPFSRGSVHIRSTDAKDPPVIDPKLYSHPLDIEIMSRALLRSLDVPASEPLRAYLKDDGIKEGASRETMVEVAKQSVGTHFHPVGTCSMRPLQERGVVNERLVVHGTKNLRVVDASIFPLQCQGNILSLVYAVAERAADVIKEDLLS